MKYKLGIQIRDKVTGFAGTATGYVKYLTGCDQYLITPKVDKEGKIVPSQWYDVNRVELLEGSEVIDINTDTEKGPGDTPPAY